MGLLNGLATVLLLAFIAFGLYAVVSDADDPGALLSGMTSSPGSGASALCYGVAYNSVTPALRSDWLPPEGTYIPLLEDLPLPDGSDFLGLGLAALLGIFILRHTVLKSGLSGWAKFGLGVLLFAVLLIGAWLLIKFVMFLLMYRCGAGAGLSHDQILNARNEAIAAFETAGLAWPVMLFGLFGGLGYLKLFFGGKE